MPNPFTGQPWPWEPQPPPQAATADPAALDQITKSLKDANGGLMGDPSPVTVMGTGAQANTPLDTGYKLYTFQNGASIEINAQGQTRNWKPPPSSSQTAAQQQQRAGVMDLGSNGVWVQDANGQWGPSVDTLNKQQLTGAQQVAQTGVYQGQGNLYNQQAGVVQGNAAAQQGLQGAQAGLYGQQAGVVQGNAAAQQALQGAQAGLYGQQAGVVAGNAAAQQALQGAQAGLYGQQAGVVASNAAAQQALQGAQAGLYGAQAANQALTGPAQAALYGAQANLQNAQAAAEPGTAAAQQALYGAQAQNQLTQAANAMNPAMLTVQLGNQANQFAAGLQQQVSQGKLSPDQAGNQFQAWYATNVEPMKQQIAYQQATQQAALNSAQAQAGLYQAQAANYPAQLALTASDAAQKNALAMVPYVVNQSALTTPGVTTGAKGFPQINPQQVMQNASFSLPNLQEIGRQGAAAALANFSPTAQAHLSTPAAPTQPPVAGMPGLAGLLNMNNYAFGTPQLAAGPATNMQGAPGVNMIPTAQLSAMSAQAPQTYGALSGNFPSIWGQYQPAAA